jgi:hypothetical protein
LSIFRAPIESPNRRLSALQNAGTKAGWNELNDALCRVFKLGGANISPDWVSFEIGGATSGNWSLNCEGRACTGLSHVMLVPEPGMLALFGAGILGAGLLRRRRRAAC